MKKLLQDCFTGVDGVTFDLWRIMAAIGLLPIVLIAYVQVLGAALALIGRLTALILWSPADWGLWATGAFCTTLTAAAGAVWIKKSTEPSVAIRQTTNDGQGNSTTSEVKS